MSKAFLVFIALAAVLSPASAAQRPDLNTLIDNVDRTFSRMKDFSADFVQIARDPLNRTREESGHLYLMRGRKMRWDYRKPEEKRLVSDGKTVWLYQPVINQVREEKVKESGDERLPIMFLLGRSDLRKEFERFSLLNRQPRRPGDAVIQMVPEKRDYIKLVEVEVDPQTYILQRLELTYPDDTRVEYLFSNVRTNVGLNSSLFDFEVPSGAVVLEGVGQ